MKWPRSIFLIIVIFTFSCTLNHSADQRLFLQIISQKQSGTQWKNDSLLRADLNDDGKLDYAIYGIKNNKQVIVAVVFSPIENKSKPYVLELGIGGCQKCVSQLPIDMTKELMDYDPKEAIDGDLPGFKQSKTAHELEIDDKETDPIHVFWNCQNKTLDWWRL
jgi:hypothetical protein